MKRPNEYSKPLEGVRTEKYHPADLNGQYAKDLNKYIDYLETQIKSFSPVSPAVAWGILAVRDALVIGDSQEAYHQLYMLASPNFDKRSDEVWSELEAIAVEKII
jgi:hypothetical protein